MFARILIPLDGSPIAEQVLPLAKLLAARLQSAVTLFQAIEPPTDTLRAGGEEFKEDEQVEIRRGQALAYLRGIAKDWALRDIPRECQARVGKPAPAIIEFIERNDIDLIVMATRGRGGWERWVSGSVAAQVRYGARVPVLLARAGAASSPTPFQLSRVLVPLDGSPQAESALVPAQEIAAACDAEIVLFRATEQTTPTIIEEYLAETARNIQTHKVRVRWEMDRCGKHVADCILDTARRHAASLIVMFTHSRTGISRLVIGSVADRILDASSTPVLLIRYIMSTARGGDPKCQEQVAA
ncbi:MAG: universal stress protein [Chloroflexota bacterium]